LFHDKLMRETCETFHKMFHKLVKHVKHFTTNI
jgi:hypothetical protein